MQSVFLAHMDRLLLPAYLLTGSHEQAAQCLLEATDNCMDVQEESFKAAKRAVVTAAIRRIAGDLAKCVAEGAPGKASGLQRLAGPFGGQHKPLLSAASLGHGLLTLDTFQRAALVLMIYERYSASDAASMLRVSRQTLENGWQQALITLLSRLNPSLAESTKVA